MKISNLFSQLQKEKTILNANHVWFLSNSFGTFCQFDVTLITNHKTYYKNNDYLFIFKFGLGCFLSLVCIWFAYAPFWIQFALSDSFWVCALTSSTW
jgi:hypothetical protein